MMLLRKNIWQRRKPAYLCIPFNTNGLALKKQRRQIQSNFPVLAILKQLLAKN